MRTSIKSTLIKSIIYRIFSFVTLLLIIFIVTGSLHFSALISCIDLFLKTLAYFFFEMIWNKYTSR